MSLIPRSKPPSGWKSVYETDNSADAHIVVGHLESEGIKSWVYQEAAGSALGLTVGALGTVHVVVNPEDYERAAEILSRDHSNDPEILDYSEDEFDGVDSDE